LERPEPHRSRQLRRRTRLGKVISSAGINVG
jgi:hypothetical protein